MNLHSLRFWIIHMCKLRLVCRRLRLHGWINIWNLFKKKKNTTVDVIVEENQRCHDGLGASGNVHGESDEE